MPLEMPPALSTARSHSTHSMLVLDRMEAVWRASKPSAIRPWPISRTAWPVSFQVQLRQMPKSFWRIQTLGPRAATAFQKMAGMVSPAMTTFFCGAMPEVSQSWLMIYLQVFFFFQRRSARTPSSLSPK